MDQVDFGELAMAARREQGLTQLTEARRQLVVRWVVGWRNRHVAFDQVPIFRGQALALLDARLSGHHFTVFSGDRRDGVIQRFNKKYHTHLHSQKQLFDLWVEYSNKFGPAGAIARGVFPANPPDRGTHLQLGDGVVGAVHQKLHYYQLGIDTATAGHPNDAGPLVNWLNSHGYHVTRPYHSGAEAHHVLFLRDPAHHARRRLASRVRGL